MIMLRVGHNCSPTFLCQNSHAQLLIVFCGQKYMNTVVEQLFLPQTKKKHVLAKIPMLMCQHLM